ncbi:MAG TPA: RNA polymerase sporulation sigma factor SigE [Clostridiales bacterium]|nr:RNA polymerase sporulation sigma factor SigE [Clostridiales bacterium]
MRLIPENLYLLINKILFKLGMADISHYINGPETLPAPLSAEEESRLIEMYENGGKEVKEKLIVHNLRLVVYIARKYDAAGASIEDLISIGTIGLIKAVNTFCPDRKIKLATYASRCIENEILMYLRKTTAIKSEISIDEPLNIDWDGNELLLSDILGSDSDEVGRGVEMEDEKNLLMSLVNQLNDREKQIMQMRFGLGGYEEHTQKQVADWLGISQSYISRLEKRIINRLKKDIEKAV